MDTTVLDTEKFDSMKELANIQTQIAEGRAALVKIKDEAESYIQERENKLVARINEVLEGSAEALRLIDGNQNALTLYANELRVAHDDLQAILLLFKDFRARQQEVTALEVAELEKKAEELAKIEVELKKIRAIIDADQQAIARDRLDIAEEKRKIADDRGTLERAFNRLTK